MKRRNVQKAFDRWWCGLNRESLFIKTFIVGPMTHPQLKMYMNVIAASLVVSAIMLTWLVIIG